MCTGLSTRSSSDSELVVTWRWPGPEAPCPGVAVIRPDYGRRHRRLRGGLGLLRRRLRRGHPRQHGRHRGACRRLGTLGPPPYQTEQADAGTTRYDKGRSAVRRGHPGSRCTAPDAGWTRDGATPALQSELAGHRSALTCWNGPFPVGGRGSPPFVGMECPSGPGPRGSVRGVRRSSARAPVPPAAYGLNRGSLCPSARARSWRGRRAVRRGARDLSRVAALPDRCGGSVRLSSPGRCARRMLAATRPRRNPARC